MAIYSIKDLNFSYPNCADNTLKNINLDIYEGEFILLFGRSGSGKTTLLKHLKPQLTPYGNLNGSIEFSGTNISELSQRVSTKDIGYVMQNVENQIVTDKVWHELAFGLESLGYDNQIIRRRVAEVANFFNIGDWFHKKTTELSGGQKQLLNLASIMAMQPKVLILDEPTSQLDPIMAINFLETIKKINSELGVTIILSEHRLEEVFSFSDRVILLEKGEIIYDDKPNKISSFFKRSSHSLSVAMPTPIRIYSEFDDEELCLVDIKSGRQWLVNKVSQSGLNFGQDLNESNDNDDSDDRLKKQITKEKYIDKSDIAIELKEIWFRYSKEDRDIIKDFNIVVPTGTLYAILGGNGAGKSTLLKILSGLKNAYRGKFKLFNKSFDKYDKSEIQGKIIAMLPQNPQTLFVAKTLFLDLQNLLKNSDIPKSEWGTKIDEVLELTELSDFKDTHPYDLSGGEQQRAALAKILLLNPKIILLDEPTKGLDGFYKIKFAGIIKKLIDSGTTVLMVSHDIEFLAKYADYCSMIFDGNIVSSGARREFFNGNAFYTTVANKMSRDVFKDALLVEDVIDELNKILKR